MSGKKVIIPAEFKVCATCSYWDGVRRFDEDIGVVVVDDCEKGECLVKAAERHGLHDVRQECDCLWEDLRTDPVGDQAEGGEPADGAPQDGAPQDDAPQDDAAKP